LIPGIAGNLTFLLNLFNRDPTPLEKGISDPLRRELHENGGFNKRQVRMIKTKLLKYGSLFSKDI